ncbi:sulfate transporter family-domain-containing protein [Pilobolus umbonatus]|nr:sulfate transporter family-domain-containing protein [Pilobolus umbonatus]
MKTSPFIIDYEQSSKSSQLKATIKNVPAYLKRYLISTLPIVQWIHRYNLAWLAQDAIAGVTVGIVGVPQSMAYAKIANLPPQYGLYTSFAGVSVYCLLGTSKDISVGPISTVSLLVGSIINSVKETHPEIPATEVAVTLSLFAGLLSILISVFRLGILVDFIPEPAIAGFMTGSAVSIILSQCTKLFGISGVNTHDAPYMICVNLLKKLPQTRLDVAFGLSSLVILYAIKIICNRLSFKSPAKQKFLFLFGIMRNGLIVIVGTLISYFITIGKVRNPISVIGSVPAGFDAMNIPHLNLDIIYSSGAALPSIVLILILEHMSVGKSFGRMYNYQINPDQEILAIGLTNIMSSFFGGYTCTGAFSRTAIMARSGSRTPVAGLFSALVLFLALYVLTPAFYYIPDAVLAAVVIHAVSDLASRAKYLKELWHTSSFELIVWVSAVVITIFVDVETGIYAAVGLSLAILLFKFARPSVKAVRRVTLAESEHKNTYSTDEEGDGITVSLYDHNNLPYMFVEDGDPNFEMFIDEESYGIVILRLCDSILYPNAEHVSESIIHLVREKTRCGNVDDLDKNNANRPWNQEVISETKMKQMMQFPILQALILDFSAVARIDSTALQTLLTTRGTLDKYSGRSVEWHFVGIQNVIIRYSLLGVGFGELMLTDPDESDEKALAEIQGMDAPLNKIQVTDHESLSDIAAPKAAIIYKHELAHKPRDRYPCFHWDLNTATQSVYRRLQNHSKTNQIENV